MTEFGPDIRSITSSLLRFEITPEESTRPVGGKDDLAARKVDGVLPAGHGEKIGQAS